MSTSLHLIPTQPEGVFAIKELGDPEGTFSTVYGGIDLDPGTMWRNPVFDMPDRPPAYCIVLPNKAGIWQTNERAGGSGNYWQVTGDAPNLTVTPSINAGDGPEPGNWHGFITGGVMTP